MRKITLLGLAALAAAAFASVAPAAAPGHRHDMSTMSANAASQQLASQLALGAASRPRSTRRTSRSRRRTATAIITQMIPDMGWHFLNPKITTFDIRKPPILVYGKRGLGLAARRLRMGLPEEAGEGAAAGRDVRLVRGGLPLQGRNVRVPGEPGVVCDDEPAVGCGVQLLASRPRHAPRLALVSESRRRVRGNEPAHAPFQRGVGAPARALPARRALTVWAASAAHTSSRKRERPSSATGAESARTRYGLVASRRYRRRPEGGWGLGTGPRGAANGRATRRTVVRHGPVRLRHVKAAVIRAVGSVPEIDEVAEPSGDVVEVLAASVNPIDLAVSRGILATGHPELPYVPGCEGVGRTADGRVVWVFGGALGRTANGAMAERVAIGDSMTIAVPDGADPAVAAGLGIAGLAGWLPLAWRAPLTGGENVLVLGATGAVGLVAVQAAKLLGAARVVAAGRSAKGLERATELGADATVRLDVDDLASAFKDAFGGTGPSYVFDPVWGAPLVAAVQAATPRATIVNLGQSAGATAELASGPLRFKNLSLLGHTNFAVPEDELTEHYHRLVGHVAAGEIVFDVERVPLDGAADAWQRQAGGTGGTKLVLVP